MSDPRLDWVPPSIPLSVPSSPDPYGQRPTFQSTGDVPSGPPERDKLENPGMEDISEPRQTPKGGICSDDDFVLQENRLFLSLKV